MLPFKNLVSGAQLTRDVVEEVFTVSDYMQRICEFKGRTDLLSDKVIALIFLEPSSRTMLSFQSAAQRLGAGVLFFQGREMSSLEKGESIEDTMRVVGGYSDLVVARLHQPDTANLASESCGRPFINGGDGGNEHPTQALVDAYTIKRELGGLGGLTYAFGFDPLHSRSIHSLTRHLSYYRDVRMIFVSPPSLRPSDKTLQFLSSQGVQIEQTEDLSALGKADVVYLNRLQEERFQDRSEFEKHRLSYRLTPEIISEKNRLILDPLPRVDEIDVEVDKLPIAAYFRQVQNGVPIRMALLALLLERV